MLTKRGIPVSPGVAIGTALVFGQEKFKIPNQFVRVKAVDSEVIRFRCALEGVCREIAETQQQANDRLGGKYGAIFGAHLEMARDPKLIDEIETLIRKRRYAPEFAVSKVLKGYAKELQSLGATYLSERATDMFDLEKSILRHLMGEQREELSNLTEPVIILAYNLTPSETASLDRRNVKAFVTESGGATSHTAILAGALEIPAVVGVGAFLNDAIAGQTIIVDGDHGEVIIDPDEDCLIQYRDSESTHRRYHQSLLDKGQRDAVTKDGERVQVYGNIEFPEEAEHCKTLGADGIGLYRTEFLYLGSRWDRTEEDHYHAYQRVVDQFPTLPVVIRTLDLGADKIPGGMTSYFSQSPNPELGLRSIRVSLDNQELFKRQLRAILRASVNRDVRIMFPLVASLMDLRQANMILKDVREDLTEQQIPFSTSVQVGMMVEVPSVAIMAEEFAREVDFFSIGTNDLIQYTLAADRSDPAVSKYYTGADPAILRMIRLVVEGARRCGIPVTVCGQMSSEPRFVPLLIGLGIRAVSVTPHAIPEIKEIICSLALSQAEEIARHALQLELARDVESYLRGELKRICPQLVK